MSPFERWQSSRRQVSLMDAPTHIKEIFEPHEIETVDIFLYDDMSFIIIDDVSGPYVNYVVWCENIDYESFELIDAERHLWSVFAADHN